MFIDRERDLQDMEALWGLRPQLYLLWGRRRVGKSALIRRFIEGRAAIVYQAVTGTAREQLSLLTRRIVSWRPDPVLEASPLASWEQAFAYLQVLLEREAAAGRALAIVLDEFQYLAASDATVVSRLQALFDDAKQRGLPLFLVLAGSQIGFFEEHVLLGPLHGRRTGGGQLMPLRARDAGAFFPTWSAADRLRAWGVLGGMPYYLEQFEPDRALAWNIRERTLRRNSVLYSEAEIVLREELSDAGTYFSVLSAIAGGATRVSEIAAAIGRPATTVNPLLDRLARLHLVRRTTPITDDHASSKRGLWTIDDHYLAFWFRYIRPNQVDLEAGREADVYRRIVAPSLDAFVSHPPFERACRDWVRDRIGHDPRLPRQGAVGAWWGQVPVEGSRRTRAGEADVVTVDGKAVTMVGEAKWSERPVGPEVLAQLRSTVPGIPGADPDVTRLALFSRSGYVPALRRMADVEGVALFTVDDLFV